MSIRKEQKQSSSIFYLIDEENKTITAKIPVDSAWENFRDDCWKRGIAPGSAYPACFKAYRVKKYFVGTAVCAPTDTFDIEFGKKLARSRALKQFYKCKLNLFKVVAEELNKELMDIEDYMNYSWLSANRFAEDIKSMCKGE